MKSKKKFTVADLGLTDAQKELMRKHGTPSVFASGCYECVSSLIGMDEASAAIAKYNREWVMAGEEHYVMFHNAKMPVRTIPKC